VFHRPGNNVDTADHSGVSIRVRDGSGAIEQSPGRDGSGAEVKRCRNGIPFAAAALATAIGNGIGIGIGLELYSSRGPKLTRTFPDKPAL
jgi:hypothetical protein